MLSHHYHYNVHKPNRLAQGRVHKHANFAGGTKAPFYGKFEADVLFPSLLSCYESYSIMVS